MRHILSVLACAVLVLSSCGKKNDGAVFVSVDNGRFVQDGMPQYFIGTNFWYGPIIASDATGGDYDRLVSELDTLKAVGITNLRVLVGGDGPDGVPTRVTPTLQKEPGVYDEDLFVGLDRLLAEMGKRDMKAVLFLNNSWEWSGGYGMYLEWAGAGKALIPLRDGYGPFMEQVSKFVTNDKAKDLFYNHLEKVVSRVNTVTGKPYSEDPAIFSWQIGNEPRCFSSDPAVRDAFVDWLAVSAAKIKALDPNHMVSSGNEGYMGCELDWELVDRVNAITDIDYMTIHIWPYNWSWISENTTDDDLKAAIEKTDKYIDDHIAVAARYGKPVVIEEFGFPRDSMKFSKSSPTSVRDSYYAHVSSRVVSSACEGGSLAGLNFWGWGGLADQPQDHVYWEQGDDYCGDPAQEQQGLNSVYASDESTICIISEAAEKIASHVFVNVPVQHEWMFYGNRKCTLDVEVSGEAGKAFPMDLALVTDLSLMGERDTVLLSHKDVILDGTIQTVTFNLGRLEPGFYQVNLTGTEPFNIGCNPEEIYSPQDKQPDFDAFWEANLAELASVDPEYTLTLLPEHSNDVRNVYRVEMKSLGGAVIGGYYAEPVAKGTYPAYLDYMGYGADPFIYDPSAAPQAIEFLVSVRDQGIFKADNERWIDRGLGSREEFYYRGAFCDVVRAIDFMCSREKVDKDLLFARGESQGGAFTFISAALDHRVKAIAPAVPFLGDYEDYGRIVWWPVHEVYNAADAEGLDREELHRMLTYFDVKNFTDRIECPVYMAFGLQDPTCPPHTNFSEYNMVRSEKKYMCVPLCGHAMWQEQCWSDARAAYFQEFINNKN